MCHFSKAHHTPTLSLRFSPPPSFCTPSPASLSNFDNRPAMASTETFALLNKIGSTRIGYLGALVQRWENVAVEGLSFTDWVMNDDFVETTKRLCNTNTTTVLVLKKDVAGLQSDLSETRKELAESKEDISRLLEVNRDIYAKYAQLSKRLPKIAKNIGIGSVKRVISKFNKENAAAVASGDDGGVTFGGFSVVDSLDSLNAFLDSMRARELGVPCNILETYKVFVLDGKLVTMSTEYHGGIGYSFLWKKRNKPSFRAIGWSTEESKKLDPRLGVDPVTGVNYVDPETGRMWVYPVVSGVEEEGPGSKKRSADDLKSVSPVIETGEEGGEEEEGETEAKKPKVSGDVDELDDDEVFL